jgi:hypothetical protein
MSEIFAVLLNGVAQLEYDRNKPLTDYQTTYLQSMDAKMDQGIDVAGEMISQPDLNQKTQFVAANLLHALQSGDEGMTSALCTFLATRHPDLKQIKYDETDGNISIELVFDEKYSNQVAVNFSKLN